MRVALRPSDCLLTIGGARKMNIPTRSELEWEMIGEDQKGLIEPDIEISGACHGRIYFTCATYMLYVYWLGAIVALDFEHLRKSP